jgi:hypothetical protein
MKTDTKIRPVKTTVTATDRLRRRIRRVEGSAVCWRPPRRLEDTSAKRNDHANQRAIFGEVKIDFEKRV